MNHIAVGRRLSRQAHSILAKIREFDNLLGSEAAARRIVRETHPEVCFWAFAGHPMRHNKKKPRGFDERLAVLAAVLPSAQDAVDHALRTIPRHDAARDDILDALVAGLTAARPPEALATLPTIPPKDAAGLPMEMVFYQGESSGVR
jgi:predicted RNase H-like nuclease